jgi:hypothetical protein
MPLFDFDTASNEFGEKLIDALNSQIISKRVFPIGTVKEKSFQLTGWGDLEVRFRATSGADVSNREIRIRTRQRQTFFEVRYVDKTTNEFAPRFYTDEEAQQAIDAMIDYLVSGCITEAYTEGAVAYRNWLNEVDNSYKIGPNIFPGIDDIIRAEFRSTDTPKIPPKPPVINYTRIQQGA